MFDAKTYTNRREQLKRMVQSGVILFVGNTDVPFNYPKNTYPFRQDSTFLYFFGLDIPNLAAIIDIDSNEEIIFGDELTIDDIIWTGKLPTIAELALKCGVTKTMPFEKLTDKIRNYQNLNTQIHFFPPYRAELKILLSELLQIPISEQKNKASEPLIKAIVTLRSKKTQEEIAEIERAVNITRLMHIEAMKMAKSGIKEQQIVGKIMGISWAHEGFLSFQPIVTINGQTLHNNYYGNTLTKGKLLLCDAGAEVYSHYCGDITRTTPVDGKFSDIQKTIYQIVLNANKAVIENAKVGVLYKDMHILACKIIVDGLKAIGLMKGDTDEAVKEGAHALFFPHGLGHMMGLDVHDMENLGEKYVGYNENVERSEQFGTAFLRMARPLEEGFVVTDEPGIYFIPELIDLWKEQRKFENFINYNEVEKFKNFGGIRIEDDLLISANGAKVLGEPIPKEIDEIEKICNQ